MRYGLLASASLIAFVFTMSGSAEAADCGCRDTVRAALAKEKMVERAALSAVKKPALKKPVMKKEAVKKPAILPMAHNAPPAGDCGCRDTVRAALAKEQLAQSEPMPPAEMTPTAPTAEAEAFYDYASARPIDSYPYTHHWAVAPQGYVPPLAMAPQSHVGANLSSNAPVSFAAPTMIDNGSQVDDQAGGAPDLPPETPMAFAPQGSFMAYAGGDGYAYGAGGADGAAAAPAASAPSYEAGITIEQNGWYGGVSRAVSGAGFGGGGGNGGGGGGGGGTALTLAKPDSLNGPNYNSFADSYGGDYQSANEVAQFRQQALTPPASSTPSTGTASH